MANGGTVICEALGRVEVGIPEAMRLSTQSDRICIGCSMPIYPSLPKLCLVPDLLSQMFVHYLLSNVTYAAQGDPFSFYETCQSYTWMIADENVRIFFVPIV